MEKITFAILMCICLLALSGCRVNWFGERYDAPWYAVVIPIAIIFIIAHFSIMSRKYICPHCGAEIKPKWYHFYTYIHFGNKRYVKCPVCHKTGFGKVKR